MRFLRALEDGLVLGDRVVVYHPESDVDLSFCPAATIVSPDIKAHQFWAAQGFTVVTEFTDTVDTAIVCVPRSKALTRDLVAKAASAAPLVVVDGQKTDGIESIFKSVRKCTEFSGTVTKAHGRVFWFDSVDLSDWRDVPKDVEGFETRAGVFSADKVDSASALLVEHLPDTLKGHVADLGAGWGYLSRAVLKGAEVTKLTLIESDYIALQCAKANIDDARAEFIWGDATAKQGRFDTIVMNPPFHVGRADRNDLGQSFITTAKASLNPGGHLWMVANRHLPYEATLDACFGNVETVFQNGGFKIFHATRPKRK